MTPFKFILLTLTVGLTFTSRAQTPQSVDYFYRLKNHDLATLWLSDSIQIDGDIEKIAFPEPLGFIGGNYQRFYIHYEKVARSNENSYQYLVSGKTKVKDNISNFSGTITVLKGMLYKESDDSRYKQGTVICEVIFYEDSTHSSNGVIRGKLKSNFYLDKEGKSYYDALIFSGDGFSNNECIAIWTSYKSGKSKKCNWGDFRIPDSGNLDTGVSEFRVSDKYVKNGWENYKLAWSYDSKRIDVQRAIMIERQRWWE